MFPYDGKVNFSLFTILFKFSSFTFVLLKVFVFGCLVVRCLVVWCLHFPKLAVHICLALLAC